MNSGQKRLGSIMLIISWIIGIVLVGSLYHMHFFSTKSPLIDQSGSIVNITLYRNYDRHFRISGALNGTPVNFLIDTGATSIAIPGKLADTINLKGDYSLLAHTAGGTVSAFHTRVDLVTVGPVHFQNVGAVIIPEMKGHDVLLGMNILDKFTLKQQDDKLTLTYGK